MQSIDRAPSPSTAVRRSTPWGASLLLTGLGLSLAASAAVAQDRAFEAQERFALADDRWAAVERLLPGTEEHAYYTGLLLLQEGRFAEFDRHVEDWPRSASVSEKRRQLIARRELLAFSTDPTRTWAWLMRELRPPMDHVAPQDAADGGRPTRLDPAAITDEAFLQSAVGAGRSGYKQLSQAALRRIDPARLDGRVLREWLGALESPDLAGLVPQIARDLAQDPPISFGYHAVHRALSREQLDELLRLAPDTIGRQNFVDTYLQRLAPGPAESWRTDPQVRGRYLQRLEAFTARLNPSFDSLRVHVLHHLLAHEASQGRVDEGRLLAYLRLPRVAEYTHPARIDERPREFGRINLDHHFNLGLPPVGDDRAFVRELLLEVLRGRNDAGAFAPLLHPAYAVRVLAEANLLAGLGDAARWYDLVGEESFLRWIEQRVDVRFAATRREYFAPNEAVVLELDLKNVPTLTVRVFELDAFSYLRTHGAEPSTDMDLEGVVPTRERIERFDQAPVLRHRQRFEFPELDRPGVYVIEFAAGPVASRALVRKGRLHMQERLGSAGHVLRIFDGAGQPVPEARVWLGDREFTPDGRGEVLVPFAAQGGPRPLILRHGDVASLAHLEHLEEAYELELGVLLDRESLVAGERATLLLRPELRMHDRPVALALLEEPLLRILTRRHDGVLSAVERKDLALDGRGELVVDFPVPEGLASVEVRLSGRVQQLSDGETVRLESPPVHKTVNGSAARHAVRTRLLLREGDDYVIELRGRDGEAVAGVPITVRLQHPDYPNPVTANLATDGRGRVELGPIGHLARITVSEAAPGLEIWDLAQAGARWPEALHGVQGEQQRLPFPRGSRDGRAELSLIDADSRRDWRSSLTVAEGELVLRGLEAGDYTLWSADLGQVAVRIAPARTAPGIAIDAARRLDLTERTLLAVRSARMEEDMLEVQLANAGEDARVHLIARRYVAPWDARQALQGAEPRTPEVDQHVPLASSYLEERNVGPEQRYIHARRFLTRYPGNLLERPGLLLQPWTSAESDGRQPARTSTISGGAGGGMGGGRAGRRRATSDARSITQPGANIDLDFMAEPAQVIANLRPDEDGWVRVPREDFAPDGSGRSHVEILAVDGWGAVRAEVAWVPGELVATSRARESALPEGPLRETIGLNIVNTGATIGADRAIAPGGAVFGSLGELWRVMRVLANDPAIDRFAFLMDWGGMEPERKRELWSEYACHEMHVFLHFKDPEFFDEVVRPYLGNRGERTFIDAWLLEEDLTPWTGAQSFSELNLAERVLLLERLGRSPESIAHELELLLERQPPPASLRRALFETAVAVAALEADPPVGAPPERAASRGPSGPPSTGAPAQREAGDGGSDSWFLGDGTFRGPSDTAAPGAGAEIEELALLGDLLATEVDVARRRSAPQLYRELTPTRIWQETYWWQRPLHLGSPRTVGAAFWRDYALRERGAPFLSPHVLEAWGGASEVLLALAVIDLPFDAEGAFEPADDGGARRVRRPLLLAERSVEPAPMGAGPGGLLAAAALHRPNPTRPSATDEDLELDAPLVTGTAYGLRVVLTNTEPQPVRGDLLLALPEGAFALDGLPAVRGVSVEVKGFGTEIVRAAFYFPRAGRFEHRPGHVAVQGTVVASLESAILDVRDEAPEAEAGTWRGIAARGSLDEVVAHLRTADLERIDLEAIGWRLREATAFERIIAALRERFVFNHGLWGYALHHRDPVATREYLNQAWPQRLELGPWMQSPLISIDPFLGAGQQRLDFSPLVLARAHPFGDGPTIADKDLEKRYRDLLSVWTLKPSLDDRDRLELVQHLFLQGRLGEGLEQLERIDREQLVERLQYDYLAAWAAFLRSDVDTARRLAQRHREHPAERWRGLFVQVLDVLDRAEGRTPDPERPGDPTDRHAVDREPVLELAVEGDQIRLNHAGLETIELSFHAVDVEFQFSRDPFGALDAGAANHVKPHGRTSLSVPSERGESTAPLPADLAGRALMVRAEGGGLIRSHLHQPTRLEVELLEARGHLVVRDGTGAPLSTVYVKVYARDPDGSVRFHKDGYTDILGRFDYVSLSNSPTQPTRYAVLVLDDERGSLVRQASPPTR
jgi:hypothetical protein